MSARKFGYGLRSPKRSALAGQLREAIARSGRSQLQVARAIGVSRSTMSCYCTGDYGIPAEVIERVERLIGPITPPVAPVAPADHVDRILARKAAEKEEWLEQVRIQHEADRGNRRVA